MNSSFPMACLVMLWLATVGVRAVHAGAPGIEQAVAEAKQVLLARHGEAEAARIDRGVDQVARMWRAEDGDAAIFKELVTSEFLPTGAALDGGFRRFENASESVNGYFTAMIRDLRRGVDLDLGPVTSLDRRLAAWNAASHVSDDMFGNKLAFVALLNFPLTTLDERMAKGMDWSRRQWAETRLAGQFQTRVPADVQAKITAAYSAADAYINDYNVYMHHLVTADGRRPFPAGLRLITHWNLRDELKARYADKDGLEKQRMIAKVMERIVRQEIPAAAVNNPLVDWNPETNAVTKAGVKDADTPAGKSDEAKADREPDERYRQWLGIFQAERLADPFTPDNPSHIARRFNVNREIPEAQVKALFESMLTSPLGAKVGALIQKRLKRKLEPFDIWYVGFKPRGQYTEAQLDAMTKKRYPTPEAYAKDIPRLLQDLGFSAERARFLADHIVVDPARGAGHAMGAGRRDDSAHLRTRVGKDGMDYKGYNIAVHEMGHNVEQVFSLTTIDHTLLQGVPNTAFTEALAFVFQARDLELLGLPKPEEKEQGFLVLDTFWQAREIAGVALVDMAAWRWLYEHPDATPAQFREAVVGIAKDVWNRHYAPILGVKDATLLAIYSHMVDAGLYTPDYPLGHLIAFQVKEHFRKRMEPMGPDFERICQLGALTPDAWMRKAVGAPLSAEPLLQAAAAAYEGVSSKP
ncbi:MAG TPA: hypothetical protein VKA01_07710 [Vicinamibacteria bacterium]|nr:hypothetical protein [Vicinamibacteria bacterium]